MRSSGGFCAFTSPTARCPVAARAWACPTLESRQFNVPVVDLAGRCYATDVQIEVPGGQGMVIQNGVLKAGAGRPAVRDRPRRTRAQRVDDPGL